MHRPTLLQLSNVKDQPKESGQVCLRRIDLQDNCALPKLGALDDFSESDLTSPSREAERVSFRALGHLGIPGHGPPDPARWPQP